jgi:hypothetical protein
MPRFNSLIASEIPTSLVAPRLASCNLTTRWLSESIESIETNDSRIVSTRSTISRVSQLSPRTRETRDRGERGEERRGERENVLVYEMRLNELDRERTLAYSTASDHDQFVLAQELCLPSRATKHSQLHSLARGRESRVRSESESRGRWSTRRDVEGTQGVTLECYRDRARPYSPWTSPSESILNG